MLSHIPKRTLLIILTVVVAAALVGAAAFRPLASSDQNQIPGQQAYRTERLLATTHHPARNLYQLYLRLKGMDPDSIKKVVGSTKGWKTGTTVQFWVSNLNTNEYHRSPATLQYISDNAYWFVENGRTYSQKDLVHVARRFDQIAKKDRATFGTEWRPGVDNDPRIVVLVASTPGAGGYYSSADEYPKSINPFSNEHEMIYIDSQPGDPYFLTTLAHEFQHMIHWNEHPNQDVWINEGMAEYAIELNGYDVGYPEQVYAHQPDVQLNAWAEKPDQAVPHYGEAFRFMSYLSNRFGPAFMSKIINARGTRLNAIDEAIREVNPDLSLSRVYGDWLVSNYLMKSGHGRFGNQEGLARVSTQPLEVSKQVPAEVHQWGADYFKLNYNGPFTVTFQAAPRVKLVDNDPKSGQFEWYSNRGDVLDSTLTHKIDLTKVSKATLSVDMWYDIEQDFDYAYVEVSTDGGEHWQTLKGEHSTTSNPNGTNLGNGYTGKSNGWIREKFDLGPYAGKQILLRFEYVTDDGYNAQGIAIDGVEIPEIGFKDDSESGNGWVSDGWIRSNNWLPARYQLLVIDPNGGGSYVSVPVGADGKAVATFDNASGKPPVIVVSGTSLTTTQDSPYKLEVRPAKPGALGEIGGRAQPH